MKRTLDLVFALAGLVLLSPLLVLAWLCIVTTSGAPGLYRHRRVGKNGRIFTLFKFRTMTQVRGSQTCSFDPGCLERVTRLGKLLRRTKVDELPQLWNVLRGDMSLVGPRPEVPEWVAAYPDRWTRVLKVRPGITDNASLEFRNEEQILAASDDPEKLYRHVILPRKLDLYEAYVERHSFWRDLKLLLRTAQAVFRAS